MTTTPKTTVIFCIFFYSRIHPAVILLFLFYPISLNGSESCLRPTFFPPERHLHTEYFSSTACSYLACGGHHKARIISSFLTACAYLFSAFRVTARYRTLDRGIPSAVASA